MPRPSIGETAHDRCRTSGALPRRARELACPSIRIRRPADRRSRIQRWNDTIAALVELQAEYAAWLDALPDEPAGQRHSPRPCGRYVELDLSRASGDRTAARLRPGLNNRMAQTAWVTMTRGTACRQSAGDRRNRALMPG